MVVSACYQVRGIPVMDQGRLEKESKNLFGVAVWMPISVLNLAIVKKGRKTFPVSLRASTSKSESSQK